MEISKYTKGCIKPPFHFEFGIPKRKYEMVSCLYFSTLLANRKLKTGNHSFNLQLLQCDLVDLT